MRIVKLFFLFIIAWFLGVIGILLLTAPINDQFWDWIGFPPLFWIQLTGSLSQGLTMAAVTELIIRDFLAVGPLFVHCILYIKFLDMMYNKESNKSCFPISSILYMKNGKQEEHKMMNEEMTREMLEMVRELAKDETAYCLRLMPKRENFVFFGWEMEDLMIVPCLELSEENICKSVYFSEQLMQELGLAKEDLVKRAMKRMERSTELTSLFETTMCIMNGSEPTNLMEGSEEGKDFAPTEQLVLTNKNHMYGAGCILLPEVQERIANLFPKGYYILPSSVHELLIVSTDMDTNYYQQMVMQINSQAVSAQDFLSNHIYTVRDGKLVIVK